jgi:hypothetical protein
MANNEDAVHVSANCKYKFIELIKGEYLFFLFDCL